MTTVFNTFKSNNEPLFLNNIFIFIFVKHLVAIYYTVQGGPKIAPFLYALTS